MGYTTPMHGTMTQLLEGLTDAQREAVQHVDGPLLVLAGPGSGKTRVITNRVGHLIACGIPAWSILAVTFTNKAAGEMRERIDRVVPPDVPGRRGLTATTFHSFCVRVLRRYADRIGMEPNFTIYDTADQRAAIKLALEGLDLSTKNWQPASVHHAISGAKNILLDSTAYAASVSDFHGRHIARIYQRYEKILRANNAVDFDDLLLRTACLLRDDPAARDDLRERHQYILVDEYQDTNHAQFVLSHTLAGGHRNLCVVGDPDQSIYGWRGADLRNILDFEEHFPDAKTINLGQNFRSTGHIVACADALIRNNRQRKHRPIYTELEDGERPGVIRCADEHHEARLIADTCRHWHDEEDLPWRDMAVFYRVNAMSRVLEEVMRDQQIPYIIARGTAFYDRAEIKDALAYLRLLMNPRDEIALKRIINTPTRGIGKASLEKAEMNAFERQLPLLAVLERAADVPGLTARATKAMAQFAAMINLWRSLLRGEEATEALLPSHTATGLADLVELVIRESGLEASYRDSTAEEDIDRLENLAELISSAAQFTPPHELEEGAGLEAMLGAYLESVTLVSDADMVDPENGTVTLMTLHASKGLEFPAVAIAGLEDGMLPHMNSSDDESALEEERRLFYVGITRAKRHLLVTHTAQRTHRGVRQRVIASQFLRELPSDSIALSNQADDYLDTSFGTESNTTRDRFEIGEVVRHPQFGLGRIDWISPGRTHTRLRITFQHTGEKTLIMEYAGLERVDFDPTEPD